MTSVPAPSTEGERIVLAPLERRPAILELIGAAGQSVRLSMFRCTDFKVMDKLGEALERGVSVELLLTQRAKGWEKKIRELGKYLESMGARVYRYGLPGVKYHAKYLVVDESVAVISSANLTRKCFEETGDFLLVTREPGIVRSLVRLFDQDARSPGAGLPEGFSRRLIAGPETARARMRELICGAQHSLRIVDHRVKDPEMLRLLEQREKAGITTAVFGRGALPGLKSHGKLMVIDGRRAVLGSISLSGPSLNRRRELAGLVEDAACVAALDRFLDGLGESRPAPAAVAAAGSSGEDDDEEDDDGE